MKNLKLLLMLLLACSFFSPCEAQQKNISMAELEKRAANFLRSLGEEVNKETNKFNSEDGTVFVVAKFIDKERHCIYYQDFRGKEDFCKFDLRNKRTTIEIGFDTGYMYCENRDELFFMFPVDIAALLDDNIHITIQGGNAVHHNIILLNTVEDTYHHITEFGQLYTLHSNPLRIMQNFYDSKNNFSHKILTFFDLNGNVIGNDGFVRNEDEKILGGLELLGTDSQVRTKKQ